MEALAVLFGLFLVALVASIPTTNLDKTCQGAKVGALQEDQASAFQSCIRDEQAARDQLKKKWGKFSAPREGIALRYQGLHSAIPNC
jgi:hypothetical protein